MAASSHPATIHGGRLDTREFSRLARMSARSQNALAAILASWENCGAFVDGTPRAVSPTPPNSPGK